jgi:RNA polymerase sigma-70 factor (ECF subfamily)
MAEHLVFVKVQKIVQKLPMKYQAVLSLRFFEGKSILEIAEIIGEKEGTVKSLLYRGLAKVRSSLPSPSSTSSDRHP